MTQFIPGMQLCELFYHEAVRPILESRFPELRYSAAKLDCGSDVLGFDTAQSRDHCWGPKVMLFVSDADYEGYNAQIPDVMAYELPFEIHDYPTHFDTPEIDGGILKPTTQHPINHGVTVTTSRRFFQDYLGLNPLKEIDIVQWLTTPQQRLRTVRSGHVFYDGLDELVRAKDRLTWYPDDLWLYILACQWRRIDQEEPFMARCGDVGDELGSRLVAARLINDAMQLCFLMEKQYPPYYKWYGTAFARLQCAKTLTPIFQAVFESQNWKIREQHLSEVYRHLARMHNDLGITGHIDPENSPFYSRPYLVPHSHRFVDALRRHIQSPQVKQLPNHIGAINQFVDSTDALENEKFCNTVGGLYQ